MLVVVLAAAGPFAGSAEARSAEDVQGTGVEEWRVSFEVLNKNESATSRSCTGDGGTYTLRGSLVGPHGVRAGEIKAVTLYVPGSGDGSTWHFTAAPQVRPGVDHVTEMARLGHASVSVHPLGFGASDPVHGNAVCFGAYADQVAQVIEQLRQGSYGIDGSAPAFERVVLAGHSAGGIVAELTQVSFAAADALVVAGWAGGAAEARVTETLDLFPYGSIMRRGQQCVTSPERKWGDDGPGGWAYLFDEAGVNELVYNIDPAVLEAFLPMYERDPCGWHDDLSQAVAAGSVLAPTVKVPVLLGSGVHDPIAPPAAVKLHQAHYAIDNGDVTSFEIPASAHQVMMNRSAPVFRTILDLWLEDLGS